MRKRRRVVSWRHKLTKQNEVMQVSIVADSHHTVAKDVLAVVLFSHEVVDLAMHFYRMLRVRWAEQLRFCDGIGGRCHGWGCHSRS